MNRIAFILAIVGGMIIGMVTTAFVHNIKGCPNEVELTGSAMALVDSTTNTMDLVLLNDTVNNRITVITHMDMNRAEIKYFNSGDTIKMIDPVIKQENGSN